MNKRDDSDKPPFLSEARHSASLLEDSALLKSVTPPPLPPPVMQAAAEPAKPAGRSFGSAVMTLVRDAHFHPPIIVLSVAIGSLAFLSGFLTCGLAYRNVPPPIDISGIASIDGDVAPSAITLTGRLAWYDTATQKLNNDSGAVVILLPDDQTPRMLLPTRGARTADRNTTQQEEFATQISELGGGFATTNSDGVFTLTLEPGTQYTLLALSSCLRDTAEPIPASVTANLKRYFASPDEGIIGTARYHYIRPFAVPAETKTVPASLLHIF